MTTTINTDSTSTIGFWTDNRDAFSAYADKKFESSSREIKGLLNNTKATFDLICITLKKKTAYSQSSEAADITHAAEENFNAIRKQHPETYEYLLHLDNALDAVLVNFLDATEPSVDTPFTMVQNKKKPKKQTPETIQPITTNNSFQALQQLETMEDITEAAPAPQHPPHAPTAKPPPITIPSLPHPLKFTKTLQGLLLNNLKAVNTRDGMKIYTDTLADFQTTKDHLNKENIEYFTYQLRQDRPLRVIIRRLPNNVDTQEIHAALEELGFEVQNVRQLKKTENGTDILYPLYAVSLTRSTKAQEIYQLNRLLFTVIKVESYKSSPGIKQCFRCQRFNHTFRECRLPTRCVICAEEHHHKECPNREKAREDHSKLRCANCQQNGHTASSKKCEKYKAELRKIEDQLQPAQQRLIAPRLTTPGLSYATIANPAPQPENLLPNSPPTQPSANPPPHPQPQPTPTIDHANLLNTIMNTIRPIIETMIQQFMSQLLTNLHGK